jgi:oligopeptide transport system substrate-binding protein
MCTGKSSRGKLLPVAFCLLILLLAACDNGGNPQTPQLVKAPASKQVYTVPQVGISDLTTLDPALVMAADQPSLDAISMIYTGLVQLNDKLQVQPQLAQTWEVSADGSAYTFHLRHGLRFSDGTPLTSMDVAYSINRALQPATKSSVAPIYLSLIKDSDKLLAGFIPGSSLIGDSLLTPDSSTLIIIIKKRAPYFLSMLTYPCAYVVEKRLIATYKTAFTDHLNAGGSSGPFTVARYTHGQAIDFVPNPHYYGPHPQLNRVVFPFYSQASSAYQAYRLGQVDTSGVPLATFASDRKRKDFFQVPQLWVNYYTMNYLTKPFDNIHIRQAFALAIDKTQIASSVWQGTVIPTNHIVPQGMPGYNSALNGPDGTQSLAGNATLARSLLQQGLKEERWKNIAQLPAIKLTYAAGVSDFDKEVAAMQRMWQQVLGITVTANPVDYNTLLAQVTLATGNAAGLQMWGLAWVAEYPDQQDWLTRQFDLGVPNNNMNYGQNSSSDVAQQQSVQQQLERADGNANAGARSAAYQQAEQRLVNDVAWLPMEQVTEAFLRKPTVIGIVNTTTGVIPPDDWANIYIAEYA